MVCAEPANSRQPKWYALKSKQKSAKPKASRISGEVQLQFTLADLSNPSAGSQDIFERFMELVTIATVTPGIDEVGEADGLKLDDENLDDKDEEDEDDDDEKDLETSDETDDPTKPASTEKRRKKLRLARLKRKTKKRAYEFSGGSDVVGIVFLDIGRITDLPPERNSMFVIFPSSL